MNSTLPDLLQGFGGIVAMGLLFLGPGYCWGRWTDAAGFRRRSGAEQALWTVALGVPLAVAWCCLAGRVLGPRGIDTGLAVADVLAVALLLRAGGAGRGRPGRATRWMLGLMALFGVYCVVAVTDVQVGQRLYVSTVIADWSVRVQMVQAAMRSAAATGRLAPPINGLSTLTAGGFGHAAPLRYYYFWYVVAAQAANTFHLSAHQALAASCAWAGWGLIAAAFLALKYMVGLAGAGLRRGCFVLLGVGAVLGLDILPTALLWLAPSLHPYPEMEYWHQDRTPSFLGAVLYAPHHMAAFCALLTGFLVLLVAARDEAGWRARLGAGVFAGVAFAAAAGTSLFPTFCFVFVLGLWAVDLVRRRQWGVLGALAGAGALAVLLAHPYLKELSTGSSAATGFASLRWRNDDFVALQFARHHLLTRAGALLAFAARQPGVLLLDFFDLGFYALVLAHGVRVLRRSGRLTAGQCALGALVAGAALPAFFLSSTATSGPNDLGVDAGFLVRLGLQLAAVTWVWAGWRRWRTGEVLAGWPRVGFGLAAGLAVLGLSAQGYQVLNERLYYPVVGSGFAHKQMDAFTQDRLGERLFNLRAAYRALDGVLPPSAPDTAAIQFNPVGAMQPAETLYSTHQIASWDTGCGTSYGGDYKSCAPAYARLLFLFGNTQAGVDAGRAENDRQDGAAARVATAADLAAVCRELQVRAVVAESTDAVWRQRESWVWTAPVLVANETVRVVGCPADATR